jgi:uncharacterized protein (TIGR02246 family)
MRALLVAATLSMAAGHAWAQLAIPDDLVDDAPAAVEAANRAYLDAYSKGDVDALVTMFAPDAIVVSPVSGQRLQGRDGVRQLYGQSVAFTKSRETVIRDSMVREYGDIVIQNAKFDTRFVLQDDRVFETSGRISVVVQKTPEGWFIIDYHPVYDRLPQN